MAEWVMSTPDNGFVSEIATDPNLYTFAIDDENGPLIYVPLRPAIVIESVAVRPNITARKYIKALLEAKAATEEMARQHGIQDIYTGSSYPPMHKTLCRHGYVPVTGALRKRVSK
jgi:GNAT superfamily N-acetyltransferase